MQRCRCCGEPIPATDALFGDICPACLIDDPDEEPCFEPDPE